VHRFVKSGGFPVVAIGASAGGLKAFTDLLSAVPPLPGMAFVVVPHLAPQFKSHLTEILARSTRLPVAEIKGGEKVSPNRIYVVPANRTLLIKGGVLHLSSPGRGSDRQNPIDGFFRSLADDQKGMAIGVLLSGAGSDGTEGLGAIKARGGTTFAQDGDSAAYLSMPHSAVESGCVDFVLPPSEIGRRLGAARDGEPAAGGTGGALKGDEFLNKILGVLRAAKGVDLEFYKRSTLRRRIQRRMTLMRTRDPKKYLNALKTDPREVEQLFRDILICVTSFFREPDSFRALKATVYPRILKNRSADSPIRIWVPGCSTGEEAYSHAMNLVEFLGKRASAIPFQIFATDVNPAVIERARVGDYTKKMTGGVSAERLRRFFVETDGGYRISREIRERCVFATQNLVQDPPFMNMDLISCRNLLIYLGPQLQEKALQIFQYALKPRAILMLGRSETIGDFSGRFTPLDVKKKVFSVRTAASKARLDFVQPTRFLETESAFKDAERGGPERSASISDAFDLQGQLEGVLPSRYVPNGIIVNAELEILRFLGNTSSYLRPAAGKPSLNLRRMASGELLLELRAAIHAAKKSACAVRKEITAPHLSGASRRARIEVLPIKASKLHKEYFLVLFEEISLDSEKPRAGASRRGRDSRRVIELKENLAVSGEHLKAIIEEQESTNARLKSSNEDLLSSNEELQSINEEYETTKEELQSSNEELIASTEEVGRGNQILTRANNDLSNFLANIDIPVVMLDSNLCVHRFTPPAEKVLGLSSDEIGRSILDVRLPLRLPVLKQLLVNVLKTGEIKALEVQDTRGRWFYLILRPYRTDKTRTERSRIEGVVMALVDINERKRSEKIVQRLATVVVDSNDAVIICDLTGKITAWNKGAQKVYGYTEAEGLRMNIRRLMPASDRISARELLRLPPAPMEIKRRAKDGRILDVLRTVTVLRDDKGAPVEIAKTERDVTEQNKAERARKLAEKSALRLATLVIDSNDAVVICDLHDRIIAWNKAAHKMYGYSEAQALGMSIRKLMPDDKLIRAKDFLRFSAPQIETQRRTRDGRILDVLITVTVLRDENGKAVEVATTERDITEQNRGHREFRRLHGRVITAQETERKRLARELHDGVGQILSGVKYRLQALPGQMTLSDGAEAKILKVGGFLDHAISEIRRVSQNLMPAELVDLGLEAALLTLCREFKERAGLQVTVRTVPTDAAPERALALFRIAQEALNNVGKHSKATKVSVALSRHGREIDLCVSDNGIGFKPGGRRPAAGRGIGLGSMRERAESIGGSIDIQSTPGTGTTLSVRVPMSAGGGIAV
jgi:two-component system CheB/CheR fusion protein